MSNFVDSWIQACICSVPTEAGDACGKCHHCQRMQKRSYHLLFEIKPRSKSRQILVDEIRALERFLFLKSGGERKVGLILDADRMSIQAQNAFLKTLEEPVADTLLLLVTQNINALLPTIRSRCQTVLLLKNNYRYDFKGRDMLIKALARMRQGAGAIVAVEAAERIQQILADLRKEAELLGKKEIRDQVQAHLRDDKANNKKTDTASQALIASYYLLFRNQLTSAIHTWFSQQFLRSSGIPIDLLPNAEFYETLSDEVKKTIPSSNEALRYVHLAGVLIENFSLNISEQLALQDFCYKICAKN